MPARFTDGMPVLESALRFCYSCKLQLGTARLLEHELVGGNFHLIYCRREWRFNFDPVLIAELVSAEDLSNKDRAVTRKFPDRLIFSPRHSPFADDAGIPARGHNKKQNCRNRYE